MRTRYIAARHLQVSPQHNTPHVVNATRQPLQPVLVLFISQVDESHEAFIPFGNWQRILHASRTSHVQSFVEAFHDVQGGRPPRQQSRQYP